MGDQYGQVILLNCGDVILENGVFSNTTNGIQVLHSQNCVISNTTIEKNSMWGVDVLFSPGTTITGYTIQKNEGTGIFVELSNNTIISCNQIQGNYDVGINLNSLSFFKITNNSIENNGIGLDFCDSQNCSIIDNTIHYNTRYGVYFSGESLYNTFNMNSFEWNELSHVQHGGYGSSYTNYWDDGISQGNSWSDYYGYGFYQLNRYDTDHFPACIGICLFTIHITAALLTSVVIMIAVIWYKRRK